VPGVATLLSRADMAIRTTGPGDATGAEVAAMADAVR
jgi:hypothetical protein